MNDIEEKEKEKKKQSKKVIPQESIKEMENKEVKIESNDEPININVPKMSVQQRAKSRDETKRNKKNIVEAHINK